MFASTFIIAKAVINMHFKINSALLKASDGTNYHNQESYDNIILHFAFFLLR
jgi:hypothetical protein